MRLERDLERLSNRKNACRSEPRSSNAVCTRVSRLKIAMVAACPFPANRGTPSRILQMSEALADLGHEVHVVTYHYGVGPRPRKVRIHRIPFVPYRRLPPGPSVGKLLLLDPLLTVKLYNIVGKFDIDLIHAHHFEGALAGLLVRSVTGKKVLYDAHTTLDGELHYYPFIQSKSVVEFLDRQVPKRSDHVVAVSDSIRDFLEKRGVEGSKIDVVPTGVIPEEFENGDADRIRKKHRLGDRPIIMYTGSVAGYQGVDYLIQAMPKISARHPEAILMLVGEWKASERDRLNRQPLDGNIRIVNGIPFSEISDYLSAADIVVSPRTECPGMPQKLVNYMAAGKAIVAFEGSAKFLRSGQDGMVVQNGDVEAMAEAVVHLIEHPARRRKLGENARVAVLGKYDWLTLSRRLERRYYKILGLPDGSPNPLHHCRSLS